MPLSGCTPVHVLPASHPKSQKGGLDNSIPKEWPCCVLLTCAIHKAVAPLFGCWKKPRFFFLREARFENRQRQTEVPKSRNRRSWRRSEFGRSESPVLSPLHRRSQEVRPASQIYFLRTSRTRDWPAPFQNPSSSENRGRGSRATPLRLLDPIHPHIQPSEMPCNHLRPRFGRHFRSSQVFGGRTLTSRVWLQVCNTAEPSSGGILIQVATTLPVSSLVSIFSSACEKGSWHQVMCMHGGAPASLAGSSWHLWLCRRCW
jgi:hypothetical protein